MRRHNTQKFMASIHMGNKHTLLHSTQKKFCADTQLLREVSELQAIPDVTQTQEGVKWEWMAASELAAGPFGARATMNSG